MNIAQKKSQSIILALLVFSIVTVAVILFQYSFKLQDAVAQSGSTGVIRLTGYAWSENIGWISFKDGSSPVRVDASGNLTGYAWSENIGWIQFGGLAGFPSTTYESATNAKLVDNRLSGWARVVSGMSGDNRGEFDGWIALSGVTIQLDSVALAGAPAPTFPSGCTSSSCANGAAWGSDVVGWVDFSGVTTSTQKNACIGSYGTVVPDGSNFTFFSKPDGENKCTTQVQQCIDGVLTPNDTAYTELSCGGDNCIRGGKTYKNGEKATFYSKAIAGVGQSCDSFKAELTCTDGAFLDETGNEASDAMKYLKCILNPNFIEQ